MSQRCVCRGDLRREVFVGQVAMFPYEGSDAGGGFDVAVEAELAGLAHRLGSRPHVRRGAAASVGKIASAARGGAHRREAAAGRTACG